MRDMLLILNFDKRFASAAAIRLRAERIYCRIVPADISLEEVIEAAPMGLILCGALGAQTPENLDGRLLRAGIPLLALGDCALCLGQLLSVDMEEAQAIHEVRSVRFGQSALTAGVDTSDRLLAWVRPFNLPPELQPIAWADEQVVGFKHTDLPLYALQFQIEQNDPDGMRLLMNFAQNICGCSAWWSDNAMIATAKAEIAEAAGGGSAVAVMTGGLDSGVAAVLAHRALGDRLRCIFVDSGLLRQGEQEEFVRFYRDRLNLPLTFVHARDQFLQALQGRLTAEEKSAAIHATMAEVLQQTTAGMAHSLLVRSTSCNDILRTGDTYAAPVGPAVQRVIEPLRELFKEEIRHIGEALGLPAEIYLAQPFPGTGLALRQTGEVTPAKLDILRRADAIFTEEITAAQLARKLWKYFAVLHDIPYENQRHAYAVALRAVNIGTVGGVSRAMPARLPWDLLERYEQRLRQACPEVVKVFYDFTPGDHFSDIEWR